MRPLMATVLENSALGKDMLKLVLYAPQAFDQPVLPGAFVHIKVPGATAHLLRRPISIMDADETKKTLTLAIMPKGEGTKLICAVKAGDQIDIIAPLGNHFSLNGAKTVWAMGGGVGVAPMLYACKRFYQETVITAIMGFRTAEHIFCELEFTQYSKTLVLCTDDGSCGLHGNVADAAHEKPTYPELIIACGPTPMLKAVQAFALEKNIPCQLSLEQRMGCGYGACLTCSCKTQKPDGSDYYSRVCADGPVFDAKVVLL